MPGITLSIVSHGQGDLVARLLADLRDLANPRIKIIVTLNTPEDEAFLVPFSQLDLIVARNDQPKGFGANHNQAFHKSASPFFAIVNPDIRAPALDIERLVGCLRDPLVAACAPAVYSRRGKLEDSARRFPTVCRLFKRAILRLRAPDYQLSDQPIVPDWVAGMFVVFRSEAFAAVGGFDEAYFMYMEDADICRRLAMRGWHVCVDPSTCVIHDAQRASHRDLRHLRWHLISVMRYFLFKPGKA